jgi:hypothetical protein
MARKPKNDAERRKKVRRRWHVRNRVQLRIKRNQREAAIREEIRKLKSTTPCADCEETYPHYVMDFDHVRGKKEQNVSAMMRKPTKKIWDEIAKCELVCANCHRVRTYHQAVARQKKAQQKRRKR